jgi:hypothetical protein
MAAGRYHGNDNGGDGGEDAFSGEGFHWSGTVGMAVVPWKGRCQKVKMDELSVCNSEAVLMKEVLTGTTFATSTESLPSLKYNAIWYQRRALDSGSLEDAFGLAYLSNANRAPVVSIVIQVAKSKDGV